MSNEKRGNGGVTRPRSTMRTHSHKPCLLRRSLVLTWRRCEPLQLDAGRVVGCGRQTRIHPVRTRLLHKVSIITNYIIHNVSSLVCACTRAVWKVHFDIFSIDWVINIIPPPNPLYYFFMVLMRNEKVFSHFEKGVTLMFLIATLILWDTVGKVYLPDK